MPTNRLAREKSPYLLQHAHNPVDWYPWGEEAFAKAKAEDKPIFLSVGYSTCHWCHVMERESFESEEIAALLNRYFVPIKVDREERPDVDRIYMLFVQATTGSGGWPMSVFVTPDLKPFFGGTYFPPDDLYGRPGFHSLLEHVARAWQLEREKIESASSDILTQLRGYAEIGERRAGLDRAVIDSCFFSFRRSFDAVHGGFGGAPKFPRPVSFHFLLRYHRWFHNEEALEMALVTLRRMFQGGMHDHLGGGFPRYSVDESWFVPHFEKMLYDQAQLAVSYLEAYQVTGDEFFAAAARDILDYVLRDMTHPEGAFYSAEDADSVIDPARPDEKGEGAFYVWTQAELEQILGPETSSWFAYRYGVEQDGNVSADPHGEFAGKNILFEAHSLAETAEHFGAAEDEVRLALEAAKGKLLAARANRVRPHLDDKILAGWNALTISAFAKGAQVLDDPRYRQAACRATDFILRRMFHADSMVLDRRFRENESAIHGFLDDYAFFIQALLDLYETDFEADHLELAVRLAARMIELFEDPQAGGFYSTAAGDPRLLLRVKDDYDGAEPSGNSAAILGLLRLAHMTGNTQFRERAQRALQAFAGRMQATANGMPMMVADYAYDQTPAREIVLAGERDAASTAEMLRHVRRRFLPESVILLVDGDRARSRLAAYLPAVANMSAMDGRTTAYVCENFACRLPTCDMGKLDELLK